MVEQRHLRLCQLDHVAERTGSDADGDRRHEARQQWCRRDVGEGGVDARPGAEWVECPLGGHDDTVDLDVMAAGAAQARHVPRVLDQHVLRPEHRDAQLRDTVGDALDAVDVDDIGVFTTTDERPPP